MLALVGIALGAALAWAAAEFGRRREAAAEQTRWRRDHQLAACRTLLAGASGVINKDSIDVVQGCARAYAEIELLCPADVAAAGYDLEGAVLAHFIACERNDGEAAEQANLQVGTAVGAFINVCREHFR